MADTLQPVIDSSSETATVTVPSETKTEASGAASVEGNGLKPLGQEGISDPGTPKSERPWFVEFDKPSDLPTYPAQLDFPGIELAALFHSGHRLVYLSSVSTESPVLREVTAREAEQEHRLYMSWAVGSEERRQADLELFSRAMIDASNSEVVHFYSNEAEQNMATLEKI